MSVLVEAQSMESVMSVSSAEVRLEQDSIAVGRFPRQLPTYAAFAG
jgi:hypothetical protein